MLANVKNNSMSTSFRQSHVRITSCQRHGNSNQNEVMALIKCKHFEHATHKELLNP
jgi:hypothetical protein